MAQPRFANRHPHRYRPHLLICHRSAARMSDAPIANIALHHIALPPRREHKWTGLTDPIGGYLVTSQDCKLLSDYLDTDELLIV